MEASKAISGEAEGTERRDDPSTVEVESFPAGATTGATLEDSLKKLLMLKEKPDPDDIKTRNDLVSKMEAARVRIAEVKRMARKIEWIAEMGAEVAIHQHLGVSEGVKVGGPFVDLKGWSSKDKAKGIKTSLEWRNRLMEERTNFLFHEVYPLLHANAYLSTKDILNRRFMSKEWMTSIGTFLQGLHSSVLTMRPSTKWTCDIPYVHFQGDWKHVVKFLDQAGQAYPAGGNPFATRSLSVGLHSLFADAAADPRFWEEVTRLFEKWGGQLWSLQILLDGRLNDAAAYNQLGSLLRYTPNLRSLELVGTGHALPWVDKLRMDLYWASHLEPLPALAARNPLPDIPHLSKLMFKMVPTTLVKEVFRKYGATLEDAFVGSSGENPMEFVDDIPLPKLKQFNMMPGREVLGAEFKMNWPSLQELRFDYHSVEGAAVVPQLFRSINAFRGTLRQLNLLLNQQGRMVKLDRRSLRELSLNLPHLEELSLSVSRVNLSSIDFILPMTSLKKLSLEYVKYVSRTDMMKKKVKVTGDGAAPPEQDTAEEVIKFAKYVNRLYESNIWKLLPELKKVTIRVIKKLKSGQQEDERDEINEKTYTWEGYNNETLKGDGGSGLGGHE